jgi:glutamyl-tRNA reductase
MIGAGEMIDLAARHFSSAGLKRVVIANRTLSRAQRLAAEIKAYAVDLSGLDKELSEADIVVSCTASPTPLISKASAAAAIRKRRHRPIFMLDLAVPRDIDPAVADLSDVYLFSIDDLQKVVEENRQQREVAAGGARELLNEEVARFLAESRAHDAGPAIRSLRQNAEAVRQQTVEQARRMLQNGKPAEEVIEFLANTLTNRLLHTPTQALRQASEASDPALAQLLFRLLAEEPDRE